MLGREQMRVLLDRELEAERFRDYCPNGLQVEGRERIRRLVTGVTACQALIDAALVEEADALLVHHGYFWKNEAQPVRGMKKQRLQSLLRRDLNLFAYHLPLDAHPDMGNNITLARRLGLEVEGALFPEDPLMPGLVGRIPGGMNAEDFSERLAGELGREALHVGEPGDRVETLAWCTGAAQGFIEQAGALGVDAYLSGEVSEPTTHFARETGIHYFAAGHHATERYGVQALGEWLEREYGIEHIFIDIDNPV